MKSFVGITGTTCVGKSEVAVLLAKMLGCDVISADSMQIYKGMDIGTAKVTVEQMGGVKHHMLDVIEPNCDYSSFEYAQAVGQIMQDLVQPPIIVGGTGFYFDCLVYPPEFSGGDKVRREQLQQLLVGKGLDFLVEYLKKLDSQTAEVIDLKNPVRVIRAIEIAEQGQKQSQGTNKKKPQYDAKIFLLQRDRHQLYQMIDGRVNAMIDNGLIDEVKALVERYGYCNTSAFNAIGYKEIIQYLQGDCSLQEAIDKVKLNTRHYAKRQISYFKRMDIFCTIDVAGKSAQEIAEEIYSRLN